MGRRTGRQFSAPQRKIRHSNAIFPIRRRQEETPVNGTRGGLARLAWAWRKRCGRVGLSNSYESGARRPARPLTPPVRLPSPGLLALRGGTCQPLEREGKRCRNRLPHPAGPVMRTPGPLLFSPRRQRGRTGSAGRIPLACYFLWRGSFDVNSASWAAARITRRLLLRSLARFCMVLAEPLILARSAIRAVITFMTACP